MFFQSWGDVIVSSFVQAGESFINVLFLILGALIVFLLGWIVAVTLGHLVEQIVRVMRVDQFLQKLEVEKTFEKAGWKLNSAAFIGALVKWFLLVVFLLAAANILGLSQVSDFLRDVLLYLPNVVVAAFILIVAAFVADLADRVIRGSIQMMEHAKAAMIGTIVRWSIWVFAFIAVLLQLGIAVALIQTLVTGVVAAVAIAVGLAFGLGGRDAAADFINRAREDFRRR